MKVIEERFSKVLKTYDKECVANNKTLTDLRRVIQQTACDTVPSPCGEKEVCIPNYQDGSARCKCVDGYAGKPCSK